MLTPMDYLHQLIGYDPPVAEVRPVGPPPQVPKVPPMSPPPGGDRPRQPPVIGSQPGDPNANPGQFLPGLFGGPQPEEYRPTTFQPQQPSQYAPPPIRPVAPPPPPTAFGGQPSPDGKPRRPIAFG